MKPFSAPEYLAEEDNQFRVLVRGKRVSTAVVSQGTVHMIAPRRMPFSSVEAWLSFLEAAAIVPSSYTTLFLGFKGHSLDFTSEVADVVPAQ